MSTPKPALLEQFTIESDQLASVPVDLLPPERRIQLRVGGLDAAHVARCADGYSHGAGMPPIVVFCERVDGRDRFWVADGNHRLAGFLLAEGGSEIAAIVKVGGEREARFYAFRANPHHGLPLSNDDKRAIVGQMLADAEWSTWSSRAIASHCQVSPNFVESLRRKSGVVPAIRKSKDGKERRLPASPAQTAPAKVPDTEPPVLGPDDVVMDDDDEAEKPASPVAISAPAAKPTKSAKRAPISERRADWIHQHLVERLQAHPPFRGSADELAALILAVGINCDPARWTEQVVQGALHRLHDAVADNVAEELAFIGNPFDHRLPDWQLIARMWGIDPDSIRINAERTITD